MRRYLFVVPLWLLTGVTELVAQQVTVVSSASFQGEVAPGGLATVFVTGATADEVQGAPDSTGRLATQLGGVTVEVEGRPAGLWYVSPTQINLVIPLETSIGLAPVTVANPAKGIAADGVADVHTTAPGIFSLDGSGSGSGAILNGVTYQGAPFFVLTAENPGCDKRTRLAAFATGLRFAGNPDRDVAITNVAGAIEVAIEDANDTVTTVEAEYAGPAEAFPGMDQVNIPLSAAMDGAGEFLLRITGGDIESNSVAFTVNTFTDDPPMCAAAGQAIVYNTVADLLAGDLWDVATPAQVAADFAELPGDWPLMGVGTTAEPARNGEVIGFGTAMAPELVWSDPEFPPTVRTLTTQDIPFLGLAAGDPATAISAEAEPSRPIHQQVIELAQANGLAFAGVRVSGRVSNVNYSIAHNLLKEGTPLTDPTVDKAPFQLFFTVDDDVMWELSGFYAASAIVQGLVSVQGAPVHLHGFQLDRSRAGHVGSAIAEQAEIRLYPLAAPMVRDADLTVGNVAAGVGAVSFEVTNQGANTVVHTTVQVLTADEVVSQIQLSSLASGEPRVVTTAVPTVVDPNELKIVVDPFNDVLEFNEANNTVLCPCGP
jgi:uncharacterized protein (TIGR03437 family)